MLTRVLISLYSTIGVVAVGLGAELSRVKNVLVPVHAMAKGCRECGDDDWCHRCKGTGLIHTPAARNCGHCGGSKKCPYS